MPWIKFVKSIPPLLLVVLSGCAHKDAASRTSGSGPVTTSSPAVAAAPGIAEAVQAEQLRTSCIAGRRLICGRVLKVLPDGLVVDSGYTDLLRSPLTQSWVIRGTVAASRSPTALELNQPGTPCVGLVFLTDTPRRQKPRAFDYVVIMAYPAGAYEYSPAPAVQKTIRRFSAGLDTAVRLLLQAQSGKPAVPPAHDSH